MNRHKRTAAAALVAGVLVAIPAASIFGLVPARFRGTSPSGAIDISGTTALGKSAADDLTISPSSSGSGSAEEGYSLVNLTAVWHNLLLDSSADLSPTGAALVGPTTSSLSTANGNRLADSSQVNPETNVGSDLGVGGLGEGFAGRSANHLHGTRISPFAAAYPAAALARGLDLPGSKEDELDAAAHKPTVAVTSLDQRSPLSAVPDHESSCLLLSLALGGVALTRFQFSRSSGMRLEAK